METIKDRVDNKTQVMHMVDEQIFRNNKNAIPVLKNKIRNSTGVYGILRVLI